MGMTREEKQKAIDALKISAPVMAVTQEEFNDYIQTLNKVMDWLEQEPKTGHWIEGQTDNPNIHNILCSYCFGGYPSKGHANSQYTREKFKYCPNCGSRNVVEEQQGENT